MYKSDTFFSCMKILVFHFIPELQANHGGFEKCQRVCDMSRRFSLIFQASTSFFILMVIIFYPFALILANCWEMGLINQMPDMRLYYLNLYLNWQPHDFTYFNIWLTMKLIFECLIHCRFLEKVRVKLIIYVFHIPLLYNRKLSQKCAN